MTLSVLNRILLLNILPKEGDVTTLRITRKLQESLSFSEDEHKALQFTKTEKSLNWQSEGEVEKDIEIGPKAQALIVAALENLSESKKLTPEFLPLYDLFVKEEA